MSEETSTLFTPGTMQTFMAAGFVAALLALAVGLYATSRANVALAHATSPHSQAAAAPDHSADITALKASISALEAKVKAMEKAAAAAPAAP